MKNKDLIKFKSKENSSKLSNQNYINDYIKGN